MVEQSGPAADTSPDLLEADGSEPAAGDESAASTGRPIVWAFCSLVWPHGDQAWMAVADDGRVIAQHISSSADWGRHDVGPERKRVEYLETLGTADVDYRVLPEGETPPDYVLEHNRAQAQHGEGSA